MHVKRVIFILGFVLLLAACGDKDETANAKQFDEDKTYTVGDTIKVNDLEFTLNKASFSKTDGLKDPVHGKVITIEASVKNKDRADDLLVDNLDFEVTNADGKAMDIYYGYDEKSIQGLLAKGESLKGKLFFDVDDSGKYEFTYKPATRENRVTLSYEIELEVEE